MNKFILLILLIPFLSCSKKQELEKNPKLKVHSNSAVLSGFDYLNDFENKKTQFNIDTFNLYDHSTDGGQLKAFHSSKSDYLVLDFWLFGETGKLNYKYWTKKDGDMDFKFVQKVDYKYDKPYYEKGFKIDSTIQYLSYSNQKVTLYNQDKIEVKNSEQVEKTNSDLRLFFEDVAKEIEIVK